MAATSAVIFGLFILFSLSFCYTPTQEDFRVYTQLEDALANNSFALFSIRNLFFPPDGFSPICTPIRYQITCNDGYNKNHSFLWTQYNSKNPVGQILISFAYYGIVLQGFDWEQYCVFYRDAPGLFIKLEPKLSNCTNNDLISQQLEYFTSNLRVYASVSSMSSVTGSTITSYRGYSANWTQDDETDKVFHSSYVILTIIIALLDFFIFFFSLGICANVYDSVYEHIKCKKNPYYPLFWSFVLLCVAWNVAPGWLVLKAGTAHVRGIAALIIPLQLLLAIFMKKYVDFPIPGLNWKKLSIEYQGYCHQPDATGDIQISGRASHDKKKKPKKRFFWEVTKLRFKFRVALSFIIQTLAIWGLLIFFTYMVIYSVTITISLYLFPIQTLLKIIFIKAVVFCAVFDIALLFSANTWHFPCLNKQGLVVNFELIVQLLTVISFIPILAFLSFIIGGIIFTDSVQQLTSLQGILALLPSVFLILVGWYSRGTLFPEKLVASDSIADIAQDEANISSGNKRSGDDTKGGSIEGHRPSLADKAKAYMDSSSIKYGSIETPIKGGVGGGGKEEDHLLHSSKAV